MIDSKEQYRFVSAEALKRITVKGAPYPKRAQKLVTIGEDEAYLKEAQEERRVIMGAAGEVSDNVILKVNRSLDRSATAVTSWIDPDKLAGIKMAEDGKVGTVSVATIYEDGVICEKHYQRNEQARKHYTDTKEKNEKRIVELRDALYKSIYGERDEKGEIVVEGEKDRAAKKKEDATRAYVEKSNELDENYLIRLAEMREEHQNKQNEIRRERTQAESQIAEQMASETDPNERAKLSVRFEQVKVKYATRSEDEDMRYSKATYDETEAHDAERRKLKKAYDDEVSKINKELDEFIENGTRKVDEAVRQLNDKIDEARVYMMQNGGGGVSVEPFEAMKEYDASVEEAYISKSCADKFDERPLVPAMLSTRLNRVFADLERMKIFTYDGLARRPCWIYWGPGKTRGRMSFYEEWERSSSSHVVLCDYLSFKDGTGSAEIYGTEYGIYIGNRNNADVIKNIYADVLICRYERKKKELSRHNWPRGTWANNTTYNQKMIVTFDGRIWDEAHIVSEDVHVEFFFTEGEKSGEVPGVVRYGYIEYFHTVYNGDGTWAETEDSNAWQWFIKRIALSKKKVTGDIVEKLDAAADTYAEKCKKVNDKYGKMLESEKKKHEQVLDDVQEECDKAIDEAYEQEKKDVAAAHLQFVHDAYANAQSINQGIEDAVSQKDKDNILNEWRTGVLRPAQDSESEAKIEAGKKRDQAVSDAYDRKSEATEVEYKRYREAREPINKELTDELNELSREYYGYYSEVKKEHVNGIRDKIYKARQDKVDAIFDTYDDKLEGANEEWAQKVKEATDELRSKNPYDGKKDPWGLYYDTPLSDNQKEYIARTIETEEQRKEFSQYLSDEVTYYRERARADTQYEDAKIDLLQERYKALEKITTEDVNTRTLWSGSVDPMGENVLEDPDIVECVVIGKLNVFVVTEPRTLTGVDFSKYYDEIREEEEKEKRKGDQ